jgi:plasmid maintenance system antidote protein VapI
MIDEDITVTELAEWIGCSVSMLSHSINGTKKPPFDTVVALANFFRVKVDDLIQ